MSRPIEDLTGRKFNRLTVISFADKNKHRQVRWNVRCDCGKEFVLRGDNLKSGHTRSCGCYQADAVREHCRALGKANAGLPGQAVTHAKVLNYKQSAAERNYTWGLTEEDTIYLFNQDCYYCSAKPRKIEMHNYSTPAYLNGIDRVDNELGYNLANCVPCCKTCQFKKKECTIRIAEKMVEFKQTGYIRKETK